MTENIVEALPVEQITNELQQKKAERLARTGQEGTPSELSSSLASGTDGVDAASMSSMQSSSFIHTSQMGESSAQGSSDSPSRRTKAQLWNELKISCKFVAEWCYIWLTIVLAITRALTLIYTLSLLTLFTRIQLNLLGRRNYISSVAAVASPPPAYSSRIAMQNNDDAQDMNIFGNDFNTNRKYLTFSWWLLHRGYKEIMTLVSNAVKEVFGPIPPTEIMTPTRLSSLILQTRQKIEGSTEGDRQARRWLSYLLPPQDEESAVLVESGIITPPSESTSPPSPSDPSTTQLRRLLDETADLIDSPPFNRIHTLLLNSLFTHLIDVQVLNQAFPPSAPHTSAPPNNDPSSSVTIIPAHPSEPRTKLANILAVLTRHAHAIGDSPSTTTPTLASSEPTSGLGNSYVDSISREVSDLESFAAVIYAGNLQEEGEALGNALSENLPAAERSSDSLTEGELREGLGLGFEDRDQQQAQQQPQLGMGLWRTQEMVQGQLERVWGRAKEMATRR